MQQYKTHFEMRQIPWRAAILSLALLLVSALAFLSFRDAGDFPAQPVPAIQQSPTIVILGNSITYHGPKPKLGWNQSQGMAASSRGRDYAHLLIARLGISSEKAHIRNVYPFETNDSGAKGVIASLTGAMVDRPRITVLQLGDNVKPYKLGDLYRFRNNYEALAKATARSSGHVYCVSTFWQTRVVDWIIKSACSHAGGSYVDIGDIYGAAGNPDFLSVDFPDPGVDKHPKDFSMQRIADRLASAIGNQ
jgi:hypothetical protein